MWGKPMNILEAIAIALTLVWWTNENKDVWGKTADNVEIVENVKTNLFYVEYGKWHRFVTSQLASGFRKSSSSVDNHARWLVVAVVVMMSHKLCNAQFAEPVRHQHDVLRKVVVVQGRVRIVLSALADDQRTEDSIGSLETYPEEIFQNSN
jgi:hypothetical protein